MSNNTIAVKDRPAHRHSSVSMRSKNVTRDRVTMSLGETAACMNDSTPTISHNMVMPSTGGDICRRRSQKVTRSTNYVSTLPMVRQTRATRLTRLAIHLVVMCHVLRPVSVKRRMLGGGTLRLTLLYRPGISETTTALGTRQQMLYNITRAAIKLHQSVTPKTHKYPFTT